jgi:protein-S-isoprenylcysteine O-methyltransferase Ste14
MGFIALLYGILSYLLFHASFLYAVGFFSDTIVPKGINDGLTGSPGTALAINLGLLSIFAVQHSVMARPGFKAIWTRIVPQSVERSTYVLLTNLILFLIFWQWRPFPGTVWQVENAAGAALIWAVYALGWLTVVVSTFLIDHFDLFGLRQVWLRFRNREYTHLEFQESSLYRHVRHPILLGFMIAFWATPHMTWGHLLFACVTTAYMLVAIRFEERDLVAFHGDRYRAYRKRVPMILPFGGKRPAQD